MEETKSKKGILFSEFCPYLNRNVTLYRNTWYDHIVTEHPRVSNRIPYIKEIISKDTKEIFKYRKKRNPNKIALFKECPHQKPLNKYIKIAIELIDDKKAVITTVHGQNNLPGNDMEVIP